jgi:hypothetical protein
MKFSAEAIRLGRVRRLPRQKDGQREHNHRRCQGRQPEPVGEDRIAIVLEEADRIQRRNQDHSGHVGHAGEKEEGHCSASDVLGAHASPMQRPRPEREPAGAAHRQHGVGCLLGHRDLIAQPPGHPGAEHRPEHDHVGKRRKRLERHPGDQECGRGVRDVASQAPEPRPDQYQQDHGDQDHRELEQPAAKMAWAEPIWHRPSRAVHRPLVHDRQVPRRAAGFNTTP